MASKNTSLYGWCFLLAGMSSASGALTFYGRAGYLFFNCQQLRLRYGRVLFPARHTGLSVVKHTQKRALCLGRRYEKMLLTHSFLFRCVSQPPPLRGTSFHRKEGEPCPCTKAFLHGEGSNARMPLSRTVISSESEKSFSFALKWCMRANGNGKPDTP